MGAPTTDGSATAGGQVAVSNVRVLDYADGWPPDGQKFIEVTMTTAFIDSLLNLKIDSQNCGGTTLSAGQVASCNGSPTGQLTLTGTVPTGVATVTMNAVFNAASIASPFKAVVTGPIELPLA